MANDWTIKNEGAHKFRHHIISYQTETKILWKTQVGIKVGTPDSFLRRNALECWAQFPIPLHFYIIFFLHIVSFDWNNFDRSTSMTHPLWRRPYSSLWSTHPFVHPPILDNLHYHPNPSILYYQTTQNNLFITQRINHFCSLNQCSVWMDL